MTDARAAKIAGIARDIPLQAVDQGPERGRRAVVGWGPTYGPITRAVGNLRADGSAVTHIHLRHIWQRSEERSGGKECVGIGRSRASLYHVQKYAYQYTL